MAGPALEDSDTGSDGNCFRAAELLSGGWSASCSQEATFKLRLHDPRSQRGGGRGCGELSGLECRWPEAWGSGEGSSETSLCGSTVGQGRVISEGDAGEDTQVQNAPQVPIPQL